jgi:hypothetical protein
LQAFGGYIPDNVIKRESKYAMHRFINGLSWALLVAGLMVGPVVAALLLSFLIVATVPQELRGTWLAIIAAVPITLYVGLFRRRAGAALG